MSWGTKPPGDISERVAPQLFRITVNKNRGDKKYNVIPKAAPLTTDPVAPHLIRLNAFYREFSIKVTHKICKQKPRLMHISLP